MAPAPRTPAPLRSPFPRTMPWSFLGRVAYGAAVELQERVRAQVLAQEGPERLLLLEHPPVFTLGKNASEGDVLASRAWLEGIGGTVAAASRGGQVTYHGPGQLMGYPIVDLDPDRRDLRRYMVDLQEVLIRSLADHGVEAHRRDGPENIGLWVRRESAAGWGKIASLGVHVRRWVTLHGFAVNATTDLSHFGGIVACGLPGVEMVSIESLGVRPPSLEELAATVAGHFGEVFGRRMVREERPVSGELVPGEPVRAVAGEGGG